MSSPLRTICGKVKILEGLHPMCSHEPGHEGPHSWESAEIAQGKQHFHSVEEWLTERGWKRHEEPEMSKFWQRRFHNYNTISEAAAFQIADDILKGWTLTGLTLEKPAEGGK